MDKKSVRERVMSDLKEEALEEYLSRNYGWDKFYGRLDKPFHRPECLCDACLEWIIKHPVSE